MKNILTKEGEMSIDFEDNLYQDAKISDVGLPTYWGHHKNVQLISKIIHTIWSKKWSRIVFIYLQSHQTQLYDKAYLNIVDDMKLGIINFGHKVIK